MRCGVAQDVASSWPPRFPAPSLPCGPLTGTFDMFLYRDATLGSKAAHTGVPCPVVHGGPGGPLGFRSGLQQIAKRPVVASRTALTGRDSAGKGGIGLLTECSPDSRVSSIHADQRRFSGGLKEAVDRLSARPRRPEPTWADHRKSRFWTGIILPVGKHFSPTSHSPVTPLPGQVGDVPLLRKPGMRMHRARAGSQHR